MISTAIASFVLVMMNSSNIILPDFDLNALKIDIPIIKDIPFIGSILSGHPIITYLAFIMIFLMYVVMYHTKFGIYVRVVGESEEAAKAIGLHTDFYKYAAILIGAVGCALGGMNMSLERLGLFTNDMTAGRGFIAIAAIYWRPGPSDTVLHLRDSVRSVQSAGSKPERVRRKCVPVSSTASRIS